LRALSVIDAGNIEFPSAGAEDGGAKGNAIADFPMEAFGGASADNGALAIFHEVGPLVIRNDQFGKDLALALRIDDELRKEILLFLVDGAEPVVVRDDFHTGNARDLVAIGKGERIDDGSAIDDDETIGSSDVCAAAEGIPHNSEKGKQEKRHGKRADGENEA